LLFIRTSEPNRTEATEYAFWLGLAQSTLGRHQLYLVIFCHYSQFKAQNDTVGTATGLDVHKLYNAKQAGKGKEVAQWREV
jgi:hypothetical protein